MGSVALALGAIATAHGLGIAVASGAGIITLLDAVTIVLLVNARLSQAR